MAKETNCAALPISFASLESSCLSKEIRSTTASIAELNSSTIIESKQTVIIIACSAALTFKKNVVGTKIILIKIKQRRGRALAAVYVYN